MGPRTDDNHVRIGDQWFCGTLYEHEWNEWVLHNRQRQLKHVQYTYTIHQLVQYRRCNLLNLNSNQTLRCDPPICSHVARARCQQQRTERLSQSSNDPEGEHLFIALRQGRWRPERCCISRMCGGPSTKRQPEPGSEPWDSSLWDGGDGVGRTQRR